jgi:hypothetical protein
MARGSGSGTVCPTLSRSGSVEQEPSTVRSLRRAAVALTAEQFAADGRTWWHGTRYGRLLPAVETSGQGFHVGTYEAARQALAAQCGWDLGPLEQGPERHEAARAHLRKWTDRETANPDGSYSYATERLAGIGDSEEIVRFDGDYLDLLAYTQQHESSMIEPWSARHAAARAGLGLRRAGAVVLEPPSFPLVHRGTGALSGKGAEAQPGPAERPLLIPVWIVGEMTNSPTGGELRDDFWANGVMASNLRRGRARRGMYYRNISEDSGHASAVMPSRDGVRTHKDFVVETLRQGEPVTERVLASYPELV